MVKFNHQRQPPIYGRELNEITSHNVIINQLDMTTYYTLFARRIQISSLTSVTTARGMSDEDIVLSSVDMKAKTTKKTPRRIYIYKNGNIENIREDVITFRR